MDFKEYRGCKYVSNGSYKPGIVNSVQWYGDKWLHMTDGYSITMIYIDDKITAKKAASYLNQPLNEV